MVRNLRAIANSVTKVINPNFAAQLYLSTGNTIVNFRQIPGYTSMQIVCDVQPVTTGDLRQLDTLNIQGADKVIYLNGAALGINRIKKRGGDLVVFANGVFPEGNVWLVKANLEQWQGSTWCKVAVVLQDDSSAPTTNVLVTDLTDPNNEVIVPLILTGV